MQYLARRISGFCAIPVYWPRGHWRNASRLGGRALRKAGLEGREEMTSSQPCAVVSSIWLPDAVMADLGDAGETQDIGRGQDPARLC
jgi:hypothetical protein